MEKYDVYQQIAQRTGGNIHIGVVGPVRTGKSTLIKRFMDTKVLPGITASWQKDMIQDELPQSAAGKTIMTTNVQFVPGEAAKLELEDGTTCNVRMVDCVGYMVEGALGHMEDGVPRMVRTPWYDEEVPFEVAAETGTRKVIEDHSTIGIVVTTDGSITGIPRRNYQPVEARVINELKALDKPFVVLLNTTHPRDEETQALRDEMEHIYDVPVICTDIMNMRESEMENILSEVLYEFPIKRMEISVPNWLGKLPKDFWLWLLILGLVKQGGKNVAKLKDYRQMVDQFDTCPDLDGLQIRNVRPGEGVVTGEVNVPQALYYRVLSEACGCQIDDDAQLIGMLRELVDAKKEYDKLAGALVQVRQSGYGVVYPQASDMVLGEPELVRHGGQYGVRLKATAPSWVMMQVNLSAEVAPVVGTESQSEAVIEKLMDGFETDPEALWKMEFFGKSLHELVRDNMMQKLVSVNPVVQGKLRNAMQRVVNDGRGGLLVLFL